MTTGVQSQELVRELIGRLFESLIADTRRARGILSNAVPSIIKSFQDLQHQVHSQFGVIEALSRQLRGDDQQGGFVQTMRGIVDTFVSDLMMISKQSMRIVDRVGQMGHDVDSVISNVSEIEEMARTTRFIALNAHIEAHRSGAAGTTFRVVAEEVKRLAGDAHEFSGQIRVAIDRCRGRLNETRELVGVLASHDMNGAMSAQAGLVSTVEKINAANESLVVTLRTLDETVKTATRALQFEDILTQLLASIGDRIGQLQSVWLESLDAKGDGDALAPAFARHRDALEKQPGVSQRSLEAGTVELF
jgi:methyl-accepting chemotaxis protein